MGNFETAFKYFPMRGDGRGVLEVAFEDGRGTAHNAPTFGLRGGRDRRDIGWCEILEGAAIKTA